MLSDEEKEEYEELKSFLYQGTISQYGKRKLIEIIEKQSKEIEELKEEYNTKLLSNAGIYQLGFNDGEKSIKNEIKAKIEEVHYKMIAHQDLREAVKQVLQSLLEEKE